MLDSAPTFCQQNRKAHRPPQNGRIQRDEPESGAFGQLKGRASINVVAPADSKTRKCVSASLPCLESAFIRPAWRESGDNLSRHVHDSWHGLPCTTAR